MISLANLDESAPYLGQLKEAAGPVTIINTFVAPEGKADEVLAAWADDAAYMKTKPGFVSGQLFGGVGGSRIFTNVAVWESTADLAAASERSRPQVPIIRPGNTDPAEFTGPAGPGVR